MIVLGQIRTANTWELEIPRYHRAHLSLYPETTVYMAAVPPGEPAASHFVELFGTTIQADAWPHVFRVSLSLHDASGVLHEALASVARHGGNVLQLDSTSVDQERRHEVEMVVDFAGLDVRCDSLEERSALIQGLLVGDCYRHIVSASARAPRVRVRPISSLHRSSLRLQSVRSTHQKVVRLQVQPGGVLRLPDQIIASLQHGSLYEGAPALDLPFRYLITSDTKDRVFRVFLIPPDEVLVWCAIRHLDVVGALSAITGAIKEPGISVLTALNRVKRHLGVNWFQVVLSKSDWKAAGHAAAQGEVQKALTGPDLASYRLGLYFDPETAGREMKSPGSDDAVPRGVVMRPRIHVRDWLEGREVERDALARARNTSPHEGSGGDAARALRTLASGIKAVRRATGLLTPQLFISVEHTDTNEALVEIARNWCLENGVKVDVVKHSRERPTIRRDVYDRIYEATLFLGIWTPSGKADDGRPSPWVVWELALAHAFRRPYRVLMRARMNTVDYMAIYPEKFYRSFRDAAEFKRGAEAELTGLLTGVGPHAAPPEV